MGEHLRVVFRALALGVAVAGASFVPSWAQAQSVDASSFNGGTIANIRIDGTERIEPATVLSYLSVKPGDPFSADAVNQSLKQLYATGLFADVKLAREGNTLVVKVVENPIINRIAFEGNDHIDTTQLQKEVQLQPRIVYTRTKVQADVQRILDLYRRNGRFAATVVPKIIEQSQNRVDLVFEINEGPKTGISHIVFVGNTHFSSSELRDQIQTKESAWYRFLSNSDTYDPDRLNADKEALRRFYLTQGYADFRVISAVAELNPKRTDFYITFTVEEGERYKFGKIGLKTSLPSLDPEKLRDQVTTKTGDWYDAQKIEDSISNLTTALGNLQYAFTDIKPEIHRNRETHTIDLTYQIDEGPKVFVQRIEITGNVRTEDKVIRREMQLAEGDPFNASKLARSEQRIKDLDFFEKVDVKTRQGSAPDQTIIDVNVAEKSTGSVSLGAGYSTSDGPLGDFGIREKNLLGKGEDLRFDAQVSGRTQNFNIGFTEPYLFDRPLSAGFDLFRTVQDNQKQSDFNEENTGFRLRMGYHLSEHLTQNLNYTLSDERISDVSSTASRFIREQQGSRLTSSIGQELLYDRRNSKLNPTDGYFVRLNNDLAGFGGDAKYFRSRLGGGIYFPLADQWTLHTFGELGYIVGIGQNVSIGDRFFLGGDSLRGFADAGVGPRDLTNGVDDALGGTRYYRGSAQLDFPIGLPKEYGLLAHIFTDYGSLMGPDAKPQSGETFGNSNALRLSVGGGFSWQSPLGPIQIDLGMPVLKQSYDKTEVFRFSFGTQF